MMVTKQESYVDEDDEKIMIITRVEGEIKISWKVGTVDGNGCK